MRDKLIPRRPALSWLQAIMLLAVLAAVLIALDLNRRAQAGQLAGAGAASLQTEVSAETTRQVELQATLAYVQSEGFVAEYARNEGGQLLPGEQRVVPLVVEATPAPTAPPAATPDPAARALPWQAWWQLLTDAPLPSQSQ